MTAILLGLANLFAGSLVDLVTKMVGMAGLPRIQVVATTSLTAAGLVILWARKQRQTIRPRRWKPHLLRLFFLLFSAYASLIAYTYLPLSIVYVVSFVSPCLMALYARLFMGETLDVRTILAIGLGFVGVILALEPWHISTAGGALIGYAAAVVVLICTVGLGLLCRTMGQTETPASGASIAFLLRGFLFAPLCTVSGRALAPAEWGLLLLLGALIAVTSVLGFEAYKRAPVTLLAPLQYVQLIFVGVWDALFWGITPSLTFLSGACVIMLSGFLLVRPVRVQQDVAV